MDYLTPDASIVKRVLDRAVQIQQIPAPTGQEEQRAAFVRAQFEAEGLADISTDEVGNVYARLPGTGRAAPLVVSAHTDTVFPADTDLTVRVTPQTISGPGIGDNSLGVAGLFGLVWLLRSEAASLPGDIWLVANTGEEGLGNLRGMRAAVDRFGDSPRAYLIVEGMALGQVYYRGLEVQRYRIRVDTGGGHSWVDYKKPSAVHIIASLITQITGLPVPEEPRTSLNVGTVHGGTTVNTIAPHAELELDLRSERSSGLAQLEDQVERLVRAANRPDVKVSAEIIGRRPSGEISTRHPLVQLAVQTIKDLGIQPILNMGSTDANIPLSLGYPAICLGLTTGSGAHSLQETIKTAPLEKGLSQLLNIVVGVFHM